MALRGTLEKVWATVYVGREQIGDFQKEAASIVSTFEKINIDLITHLKNRIQKIQKICCFYSAQKNIERYKRHSFEFSGTIRRKTWKL